MNAKYEYNAWIALTRLCTNYITDQLGGIRSPVQPEGTLHGGGGGGETLSRP